MTRKRMKETRSSITKSFRISGGDAWHVTVGLYQDGTPGEIFIHPPGMGSLSNCLADSLAVSISVGLQSGIPIAWYASKLKAIKSEPSGFTGDPEFPMVSSHLDYIGRWLEKRFVPVIKDEDPAINGAWIASPMYVDPLVIAEAR